MMLDHDYDYRVPMVKVQNGDHPDGFVLMTEADYKQRRADRAEAKKRGDDPDDIGPDLVLYKDKPDQVRGAAGAPGK